MPTAGIDLLFARVRPLAVALLLIGGILRAAPAQEEADQAAQQLDRLRREIQEFEKRLNQSRDREQDLLGELEDCDHEIALRTELIQKLEVERQKAQLALEASKRELRSIQQDLDQTHGDSLRAATQRETLADLVKCRAVYAYKNFRRDALKAFLTAGSFSQWLTRQEYLKRIAAADRSNLLRLDQKNVQLAVISSQLTYRRSEENDRLGRYRKTTAYKEQLLAEEKTESQALKERRADRENLLKRVRKDQELLAKQLEDKKQAAERIESLIKTLETQREKARPRPVPLALAPEVPFQQLKGRLNWPAIGSVVSRFGLQRHEKLATVTENPGIDIAAEEGAPVTSVCAGQVTKITWLRGYGNTVIMDHRDGYYTVYAHLEQIQVREGQNVKTGEVIGQVGQSGSISGPRLHFEIWAQREKQDPMDWLSSR